VVRGNVSIVLPRWQAQRVGGEYFSSLLVRLPLINAVLNEEANLNFCAQKWGRGGNGDLTFDLSVLNAECASLHDIGFKPSNRDLILSRSKEIIMGPAGLATVFCDQGLQLSRKLMDTKAS